MRAIQAKWQTTLRKYWKFCANARNFPAAPLCRSSIFVFAARDKLTFGASACIVKSKASLRALRRRQNGALPAQTHNRIKTAHKNGCRRHMLPFGEKRSRVKIPRGPATVMRSPCHMPLGKTGKAAGALMQSQKTCPFFYTICSTLRAIEGVWPWIRAL